MLRPLRRRQPFIGERPRAAPVAGSRPRAPLVVSLVAVTGSLTLGAPRRVLVVHPPPAPPAAPPRPRPALLIGPTRSVRSPGRARVLRGGAPGATAARGVGRGELRVTGPSFRTRGLVLIGRVPRAAAAPVAAIVRPPLLVTRRPSPPSPIPFIGRVPPPTFRLPVSRLTAGLTRLAPRGFAGACLRSPLVRAIVVTPTRRPPALLIARLDPRGFPGRALIGAPRRSAPSIPRAALLVRPPAAARPAAAPILVRPARATFRLLPRQLTAALIIRPFPRPAGPPGMALWMRPPPPRVVPRIPRHLLARRDERGYRGVVLRLPVTRVNAVFVTHGNPRATVTRRARPLAIVTLRTG